MGPFEAALARFATDTKGKIDRFVIYVVLEFRTRLIVRSPVKTGRFRNNWLYGVDEIPSATLIEVDPTGEQASARIAAGIPATAFGHRHYIVNNLPYGRSLENGSSKQAPLGMVRITVLETEEIVARAAEAVQK